MRDISSLETRMPTWLSQLVFRAFMAAFMATARCFRMNSDSKHVWIAEFIYPNISFGETICYYLLLSCCPDLWKNDASFYGKPRMRSPSNNGKLMKVAFGSPVSRYIQVSLLGTWWVASCWIYHPLGKLVESSEIILRRRFGSFFYSWIQLRNVLLVIFLPKLGQFDHIEIIWCLVSNLLFVAFVLKTSKVWKKSCHVFHKSKVHSVTFSPADPLMVTLSVKDMGPISWTLGVVCSGTSHGVCSIL